MAFCPECGKSATAEATRCIHCGHELPVAEKKAGPGRFKGTMMMAQPVVPKPAAPANGNSAGLGRDTPVAPAPEVKPALAGQAVAQPATKSNVKATMIGQGIGPLIAQQRAPAAPMASASVAESPQHVGYAKTQALIGAPPPSAAVALQQMAAPDADAFEAQAARYLPGDPMAPHATAPGQPPSAARAPRLDRDDDPIDQRPTLPGGMRDRKLIFLAIGGVVLLSVLLLAFGLMH